MSELDVADPKIIEAVEWFANYRGDGARPSVPLLRERFGLSVAEACAVLREVNLRRARAS
ncbi:hypothetical protein [Mesorhizobium sp.]|uniref:hypothetical protein n=1 Tax=Mesorhizobium sp. TaxID=1871066 RepID=UPI000FE96863|nr:hypothetical protein [Mesorhizobium sp.]RWM28501.1 MAG: hypothetical protein EOR74_09230 [Mesorhizobium sp.]